MIRVGAALICLAASSGATLAQDTLFATVAPGGGVIRGLDKVDGSLRDFSLEPGGKTQLGSLTIELAECRYPTENPAGDAFAYLVITQDGDEAPVFDGWMIASSPALNALDHKRYDVWLLRCNIS